MRGSKGCGPSRSVCATILAPFPLAGHGGLLWQPLCYAQIGGLAVAAFITLLLVPVLYNKESGMQAYIVEEPGGDFRKVDLPRPTLKMNHLLIAVQASGVNPLDTKIRAGKAAHAGQPLPAVLGLDMAGTVEEAGGGVTAFKPGDEVYGMVGGVGGLQGTLAEFIAVDADLLAHKPKNLSMRQAAALPLITITAWEGLVDRAKVHANQRVLIHAGAGGVGHIAVQIARAYGAEVFATVSPDKKNIVEGFGATPIDYRSLSVEEYVAASAEGTGFDIVYDTVGGATLDSSFVAAKRYTGHVVSCLGWGTHSLAPLSFRGATYSGVFTLFPLIAGEGRAHHGKILAQAAGLVEAGKLKPLLNEQRFSMRDIGAAHALVESGALGKVVVEL
jgi:NADPH2:quinone reductase